MDPQFTDLSGAQHHLDKTSTGDFIESEIYKAFESWDSVAWRRAA
jgi:hypothetical protein